MESQWKIRILLGRFKVFRTVFEFPERFRRKSPFEKWKSFQNFGSWILSFTGSNLLNPNYKLTLLSSMGCILGIDYFVLVIHNLYFFRSDIFIPVRGLAIIGAVLPSLIIYSLVVRRKKRERYQSLIYFASEYIYKTDDTPPRYTEMCNKYVMKLITTTAGDIFVVFVALLLLAIVPVYLFCFNEQRESIMPIILPFTDPNTDNGFYINCVHQLTFGVLGFFSMIGIEFTKEIIKNAVWIQSAVICYSLDEFAYILETKARNVIELNMRQRDICAKLNDLDLFIAEWIDLFYWAFLMQPTLLTFSVGISLFLSIANGWVNGVPFAMALYTLLFTVCKLGDEVESANDMMLEKLQEFKWYKLPPQYQRTMVHAIHRRQNAGVIQMGPFRALSYETASDLTKFCYNLLMMLKQAFPQ